MIFKAGRWTSERPISSFYRILFYKTCPSREICSFIVAQHFSSNE